MGSLHDDMMENHASQMRHSIHCGGYRGQGNPFDESQCTCRETGSMSLSREEQDDLFRQMRKWLAGNNGVMRERLFFLSEVENVYRMMATILQQRKAIEAGDIAIRQLADAAHRYREERDAAHHVIIEAGAVPGVDCDCRCEQCASVARGMVDTGYGKIKWLNP